VTTVRKVLVLENADELAAFARRVGGIAHSEPFRLFVCSPDAETPLVLAGPHTALTTGGNLVEVDLDALPTRAVREAKDVAALVGAVAQARTLPTEAIIWCHDQRAVERLVRASVESGHDAIQYATVQGPGGPVTLLRIAPPGWFTLDLAVAENLADVYVAADPAGAIWTRWGTAHPLAAHVTTEPDRLTFLSAVGPEAPRHLVARPRWEDVYQLLEFALEPSPSDENWEAGSAAKGFVVPLRFVTTHRTRTPVLWVLEADGRARLEELLGAMDEADTDQLQFALLRDPHGEEFILLRERHAGRGHQYIDFPARALAPWQDYQNLFVPVDQNIEPYLRRDTYREVFGLQPRRVTAAWVEDGQPRVVHLSEASFEPLSRFVDYIVGSGAIALRRIAAEAVFDFGRHRLVRRAELPEPPRPAPEAPAAPIRDGYVIAEQMDEVALERATPTPVPMPEVSEPAVRSALEEHEVELETEIIIEGQTIARWRDLGQTKLRLGRAEEAAHCAVEAMWLGAPAVPVPDAAGSFRDLWARVLTPPDPAVAAHWLAETRMRLAAAKPTLRKKERWMLWERVLEISPDPVGRARVREEILDELAEDGLRPRDIPSFIQRRTYETRFVTGDGSSDELQAAQEITELVGAAVEGATTTTVVLVGRAILAYGCERLGDELRATDLREAARRAFETAADLSPTDRAWLALYVGAAYELRAAGSGAAWLDRSKTLREGATDAPLGAEELAKVAASLLERGAAESPTAFLAAENFRALYPSEHKYAEAIAIQREVEGHIRAGEFESALQTVQSVADDVATGARELELRQLAWLLGHVVGALTRIGRAADGTQVLSRFAEGIPEVRTVPMRARLYCVLARIKLGEGFLEFGDQNRGMHWLCEAVRAAWDSDRPLVWLDHLDMLSAALAAVESAPVEARAVGVGTVLDALFLDRKHNQDTPDYRHIKLRLLDHCLEVGLSKERLSMRRYKRYLDEDEYHVRSRIVRRTP
jgi:hypothetical protein